MKTNNYDDAVRIDTIVDLNDNLIKTVIDVLKLMGDDPHYIYVIASAFAMAIKSINKEVSPDFLPILKELLEHRINKRLN